MRLKSDNWKRNRRATHCHGRRMMPTLFYLRGAERAVLVCRQCGRMVVTEVQSIRCSDEPTATGDPMPNPQAADAPHAEPRTERLSPDEAHSATGKVPGASLT